MSPLAISDKMPDRAATVSTGNVAGQQRGFRRWLQTLWGCLTVALADALAPCFGQVVHPLFGFGRPGVTGQSDHDLDHGDKHAKAGIDERPDRA